MKKSEKHFKFSYFISSKRAVAVPDPDADIYELAIRLIAYRIKMSELEKSFRELSKTENVFLFVPNLIGYGRIVLALLRYRGPLGLLKQNIISFTRRKPNHLTHFSFWFMPTNYVMAAWCYILSGRNIWEPNSLIRLLCRSPGRCGRARCKVVGSEQQVWRNAGYADRQACKH